MNEVVDIITQLVGLENRLNPYLMMRRILFGVKYKDVPQWALIKKEKVSSVSYNII